MASSMYPPFSQEELRRALDRWGPHIFPARYTRAEMRRLGKYVRSMPETMIYDRYLDHQEPWCASKERMREFVAKPPCFGHVELFLKPDGIEGPIKGVCHCVILSNGLAEFSVSVAPELHGQHAGLALSYSGIQICRDRGFKGLLVESHYGNNTMKGLAIRLGGEYQREASVDQKQHVVIIRF